MSFGPFLGGKRVCLGKTFAETVSRIVGPSIIQHFDYQFVDSKYLNEPLANSLHSMEEPKIMVFIKERKI
jgi:cytochrome P450